MDNRLGGCMAVILILAVVGLLAVGCVYVADDWMDVQHTTAEARRAQAEADRYWAQVELKQAEAEREQAEAVRDVTGAVRSRMSMVNLVPWIPAFVVLIVLAPFVGWFIGERWPR